MRLIRNLGQQDLPVPATISGRPPSSQPTPPAKKTCFETQKSKRHHHRFTQMISWNFKSAEHSTNHSPGDTSSHRCKSMRPVYRWYEVSVMLYKSNIFALCCCALLPTFVGTDGAGRPAFWTECCGEVELWWDNEVAEDDDNVCLYKWWPILTNKTEFTQKLLPIIIFLY